MMIAMLILALLALKDEGDNPAAFIIGFLGLLEAIAEIAVTFEHFGVK